MSTAAIITMILVQGTITVITAYFFFKVLRTPPKPEPDSYFDNDDFPDELRQQVDDDTENNGV